MSRLAALLVVGALVAPAEASAYRRLLQAIGAVDEAVFELERYTASVC
jgi:hypothetical protein